MSSLNVVCLISGGKDSFFSILHCKKNGHKIVALANLHPPQEEGQSAVDDIDSYMYQTIGHNVIPLYEQALDLPLYRQAIRGSAVNADKCYGFAGEDDETEALVPLLRNVMAHHPEVNAVSSGAILSDYQRTRVESVALRLGLTPLSYLWQYPAIPPNTQASLLFDMASVGQDSRIVKVASGGLDESFLWQNVADRRTIHRLGTATKRFGSLEDGAVLGEGGEYETLAIGGPACLWKGRIGVEDSDRRIVPGEAGSASVHVSDARVDIHQNEDEGLESLRIPPLLEPEVQTILSSLQNGREPSAMLEDKDVGNEEEAGIDAGTNQSNLDSSSCVSGGQILPDLTGEGSGAAEQMRSIMQQAKRLLEASRSSLEDVIYTSIILRDMAAFSDVNAVYGSFFRRPNPPARATIACASVLPSEKHLMVSLTFSNQPQMHSKQGLHVQSRSYWAPANIGPYSQAISLTLGTDKDPESGSLVYIAGQIPLIPTSMELPTYTVSNESDHFPFQAVLSLQHAVRVGRVMGVIRWAPAIAFISNTAPEMALSRAHITRKVWGALYHQTPLASPAEEPTFDVWDLRYGAARNHAGAYGGSPDSKKDSALLSADVPPLYIIHVDALPRGAEVEWVLCGWTSQGTFTEVPHHEALRRIFKNHIVARQLDN